MNLFYQQDLIIGISTLSAEESRHCVKALRLKKGDTIFLTDGKGHLFKARIVDNDIKCCTIDIYEQITDYPSSQYRSHIAVAPTKNSDRLEWFIEKAVELGVTNITLLQCEHSQRHTVNVARMERLMIAALKQSLRIQLPHFTVNCSIDDFFASIGDKYTQKYIAYCGKLEQPVPLLEQVVDKQSNRVLMIGPEGDFSPAEVQKAIQMGFIPISLGLFRLRTETAALKAAVLLAE
ncbi:MAG: 16S rRNA (uracil(1498)-N(3))-methyltransferase [Bacteroidales bacterium]|nr:16S rRNA (uracil(1498)-N(3))-methyltransferase [Bacteroidales bacterium]